MVGGSLKLSCMPCGLKAEVHTGSLTVALYQNAAGQRGRQILVSEHRASSFARIGVNAHRVTNQVGSDKATATV